MQNKVHGKSDYNSKAVSNAAAFFKSVGECEQELQEK